MTTAIHRTPEQTKNHYVTAMGEDLGKIFYALWQEVVWLHSEWDEYLQLFGTKESYIKLMNDAAPRFFRMIQDELVDAIVLRIARLTDPPKSTGKSNLTIQQLPSRIQDQQLSKQASNLIDTAVKAAEYCRTRRHTRIAHNALDLALGVQNQPLPNLTRSNISNGIESLGNVLNGVASHYLKSTTQFDVVSNPGGARALIRILEDGVRNKAERMAEMKLNAKNWNVPRSAE